MRLVSHSRTSGWSSTRRIRALDLFTGTFCGIRFVEQYGNSCAAGVTAPRLERRADDTRAVGHDAEADARSFGKRIRQANAIVLNAHRNAVVQRFKLNVDISGFAVFDGIADGFRPGAEQMPGYCVTGNAHR